MASELSQLCNGSSKLMGRIRLFSASSLKSLGTLAYHRETVHTLAFANSETPHPENEPEIASTIDIGDDNDEDSDDDDDGKTGGAAPRSRWLASGGKDRRIALWELKDFSTSA